MTQDDAPEKMSDTLKLWEMFRAEKYDVYLSTVTLEEISGCPEPKRSALRKFLEQIQYTIIDITDEIEAVAQKIIDMGILTAKVMMIVSILQQR